VDSPSIKEELENHPRRLQLIHHPLFDYLKTHPISRDQAATLIGQWWHPLHYFPTFLARTIAASSSMEVKSATARILFQELGEGRSSQAHESIYVTTMQEVGFTTSQIVEAEPLPATAALVGGYESASEAESTGVGFTYATEMADLVIVSALGTGIRQAVGAKSLPWVDIHVQQEPDHVQQANTAISQHFTQAQLTEMLAAAEEAWGLWCGYFDGVSGLIDREKERGVR